MAKQKPAEEAVSTVKTAEQLRAEGLKPFRIHLHASTPLARNDFVIWASSPVVAKRKFCDLNGITDSLCDWSIDEVTEGDTDNGDDGRVIADET